MIRLLAMLMLAAPVPAPRHEVPAAVLTQLQTVTNNFELALAQDCAPERCYSKGCSPVEHAVADKPSETSLPGLGTDRGPGSVAPQQYLTQARCELAYEKHIAAADMQILVKRLTQKLSQGWLTVSVVATPLLPVPPALRETAASRANSEADADPAPPEPVSAPAWNAEAAGRELWVALLPHFAWMVAIVLTTAAALLVIWALRRLGRESMQEKAMWLRLQGESHDDPAATSRQAAPQNTAAVDDEDEKHFARQQLNAWLQRLGATDQGRDANPMANVLREWLRAGDFALLSKAVAVFGDRLPLDFSDNGEMAQRKVELADYIKRSDAPLPGDAEFFRTLNQHAVSSDLLSQSDAAIYRTLRDEYGPLGLTKLIDKLPPRFGALLFACAPVDIQIEAARMARPAARRDIVAQLLASNRITPTETRDILAVLRAVREDEPLPTSSTTEVEDRGRELDAAGAISIVLPYLSSQERAHLFQEATARAGGALPTWYDSILSVDMLAKIPAKLQTDVLLDVDIRHLAAYVSLQTHAWRDSFLQHLPHNLLTALRANMTFASRAAQLAMGAIGRDELAASLDKLVRRGEVRRESLLAGGSA